MFLNTEQGTETFLYIFSSGSLKNGIIQVYLWDALLEVVNLGDISSFTAHIFSFFFISPRDFIFLLLFVPHINPTTTQGTCHPHFEDEGKQQKS
jgi:hypothetical protein